MALSVTPPDFYYEKNYPGEMIHADTKSVTKTMMVDRQRYYLVGLIDDCTRLCYVEVVNRNNAARVSEASIRGLRWFKDHGIKVEEILTDNGGEFTSRAGRQSRETHFFETAIGLFDVRHRYTQPYRPQTNGKIERFWRTLNEECLFLIKKGLSLEELRKEIKAFMYRYNYQRKHSALEYQTPLDKLTFVASLLP
jgi:transposase InsO family protein